MSEQSLADVSQQVQELSIGDADHNVVTMPGQQLENVNDDDADPVTIAHLERKYKEAGEEVWKLSGESAKEERAPDANGNGVTVGRPQSDFRHIAADLSEQAATTFPKFLELPRELRDRIYEFALVPDCPIEFAPIYYGMDRDKFWNHFDMEEYGQGWYSDVFKTSIVPALKLLRVSKQINEEATSIYYAQPFRFTNESGWRALYWFVHYIGPRNVELLKNITICHPAWSTVPTSKQLGTKGDIMWSMRMFDACDFIIPQTEEDKGSRVDHVELLGRMSKLRSLRLILHGARLQEWRQPVAQHPIHSLSTTAFPNLTVQVVNLVGCRSTFQNPHNELLLAEIDDDKFLRLARLWRLLDPIGLIMMRNEARRTVHELRQRDVIVSEASYDQNYYYPVQAGEICANKDLCDYMRANSWYDSPYYSHEDHMDADLDTQGLCPVHGDWWHV